MRESLLLVCSIAATLVAAPWANRASADDSSGARIRQLDDRLVIEVGNHAIATYVFRDDQIARPYFAHVRAPADVQVTRNHPPVPNVDRTDHDTMHPGIWMAFGDLGGSDFWRNKATVVHQQFARISVADSSGPSFVHRKRYIGSNGQELCNEQFRCHVDVQPHGYLFCWDSTFSVNDKNDKTVFFGDQEEMGLGIRVATQISEKEGGRIRDSEGRVGAKQVWSQSSRWCDYSGQVDGHPVGMTILCHPGNFRSSWMHARNYGLIVANCFGRQSMQKGEASKVEVSRGHPLRLRYAVWVHAGPGGERDAIEAVYDQYIQEN